MTRTDTDKPYHVLLTEHERGWGGRPDELIGFDTAEQADEFVRAFNARNTAPTPPDWYMIAERVTTS